MRIQAGCARTPVMLLAATLLGAVVAPAPGWALEGKELQEYCRTLEFEVQTRTQAINYLEGEARNQKTIFVEYPCPAGEDAKSCETRCTAQARPGVCWRHLETNRVYQVVPLDHYQGRHSATDTVRATTVSRELAGTLLGEGGALAGLRSTRDGYLREFNELCRTQRTGRPSLFGQTPDP